MWFHSNDFDITDWMLVEATSSVAGEAILEWDTPKVKTWSLNWSPKEPN